METKYYKVKDGKFLKLDYRYNEYPESPLNPNFQTNLGTMVCKDMKNYALGNVQVKDWEEYFRSELSDEERFKVSGKFTINMPSVEEASAKVIPSPKSTLNVNALYLTSSALIAILPLVSFF